MNELGTVLGVRFEHGPTGPYGFMLILTHEDTLETLFEERMCLYTLWEAVTRACHEVWADEIEEHQDDELPSRIATALGIPEEYDEDEE